MNDGGELLVVIADAGVEFGELFGEGLVVDEKLAHSNECANYEHTHTDRLLTAQDIGGHHSARLREGIR